MEPLLGKDSNNRFLEEVKSRIGCYYCWPEESNNYSGKDLKNAKYPKTYDCSGLVTSSLFSATGIDFRATHNAQKLMEACGLVEKPVAGDLCFYGPSRTLITHVMVYTGDKHQKVVGSSGGDSRTISPEVAEKMDAKVKGYKTHLYRPDFIAFGRLIK